MEYKNSCLVKEPNALGIFKTLYLFLKNNNFPKSANTLKKEWGLENVDMEQVSNRSILLTRCKCSRTQANQTENPKDCEGNQKVGDWLKCTFQGETFQVKREDTHVFYVCDHCQNKNKMKPEPRHNKSHQSQSPSPSHGGQLTAPGESASPEFQQVQESSRYEAKNLEQKLNKLQDEHQKLISVTSELTTALQMNIVGQTKNIYTVLEHCKEIYPSLFENGSKAALHFDNGENSDTIQNEFSVIKSAPEHKEEFRESSANPKMENSRSSSPKHSPNHIPNLNLTDPANRAATPLKTPLPPDTVRYILETIFERIYACDNNKTSESDRKSPQLSKDDVDKLIGDVVSEAVKSPSICGAGEGEFSKQESTSMRNMQADIQAYSFHIEYTKLKTDLNDSDTDNERKIRILQALRWRITKTGGLIRDQIMDSYIANDILCLHSTISIPERMLLRYGVDHYVQESTCRLINALASLKQGRDYLTTDDRLLKRILIKKVKDLRTVSGAVMRNMLIASVQKLSIRKKCRTQMVNDGLFEIMVDYLDEFYEKLSKYSLEYCSALLMNLCLVEEAKYRATKIPKKVVGLLRKFLEGKNHSCLPYINGVMFSLFEKREMVNEATSQNLHKILVQLSQITNNENIKNQLECILQSRLLGRSEPNINDDDNDAKEEIDLVEVELDQDDYITQLPSGEQLLYEYKTESDTNLEKPSNIISFSEMSSKRDQSCLPKSLTEETKPFTHKLTAEQRIFATAKPTRNNTDPRNLIRNFVRNRTTTLSQNTGRFSNATPFCYMENCQKLLHGNNAQCSCGKCIPGRSRYSCGCYDTIRKDIADVEDVDNMPTHRTNPASKSSQPKSNEDNEVPKPSRLIDKEPDNDRAVSTDQSIATNIKQLGNDRAASTGQSIATNIKELGNDRAASTDQFIGTNIKELGKDRAASTGQSIATNIKELGNDRAASSTGQSIATNIKELGKDRAASTGQSIATNIKELGNDRAASTDQSSATNIKDAISHIPRSVTANNLIETAAKTGDQPKDATTANTEKLASSRNKQGGRAKSGCKVCGEKKCDCAFESRPKLCRTPTL